MFRLSRAEHPDRRRPRVLFEVLFSGDAFDPKDTPSYGVGCGGAGWSWYCFKTNP